MAQLLSFWMLQQKQSAFRVQNGYSDQCCGHRMDLSCWLAVTFTYTSQGGLARAPGLLSSIRRDAIATLCQQHLSS